MKKKKIETTITPTHHLHAVGTSSMEWLDSLTNASDANGMKVLKPISASSYGDFPSRCAAVCSQAMYQSETYDAVKLLGLAAKAAHETGQSMQASIAAVGSDYEGASGKITFLENGDVAGPGFDICTLQDSARQCNQVWQGGVVPVR